MKIFVAGSGKSRHKIGLVIEAYQAMGHEVHDWTKDESWEPGNECRPTMAKEYKRLIRAADAFVWACGDQASEGAPWEAGFAEGIGHIVCVLWMGHMYEPRSSRIYPRDCRIVMRDASKLLDMMEQIWILKLARNEFEKNQINDAPKSKLILPPGV